MKKDSAQDEKSEVTKLKTIFGLSYIWQGASGLIATPMTFFIKEALKLSDSWGQIFSGATTIGWLIKPLWGWVSDCIPIGGKHRKPWFVLMALLAACAWIAAAIGAWTGRTEALYFFVVFNMASVGAAFVDVVGDALMVEHGQRLNLVSRFVNHQWMMFALASAVAGFIGGWLTGQVRAGHIGYHVIFIAAAILPMIAAWIGSRIISEAPRETGRNVQPQLVRREEKNLLATPAKTFGEKYGLLIALFFFIFFWNFNPSFGYINQSYLIDNRGYTPEIFGTLALISGGVFLVSIICYRIYTVRLPHIEWHHWLYAMIVLGVISLPVSFFAYLEPTHPWWSALESLVPNKIIAWNIMPSWNRYVWLDVIAGSILSFAAIPAFMIPLKIAGQGISAEHAGVQYALLMSIANFSHTIDNILGGMLYGWFFSPSLLAVVPQDILASFSGSVFDIAGTPDKRALILELFVWVGAAFTILAMPFVAWTKRAFAKRNIVVSLHATD